MADDKERVVALYDSLIEQYGHIATTQAEMDAYTDTLREYTSAVAVAASRAFAELLGVDTDVSMLELTDEQYTKLEASGMLGAYIDGKDRTDDN